MVDIADLINEIDAPRFLMILGLPTVMVGMAWGALVTTGYLGGDISPPGELILIGVGMMTYGVAQMNKKTMAATQQKMDQVHEALQNVTLCTKPDAEETCVFAHSATVEGLTK